VPSSAAQVTTGPLKATIQAKHDIRRNNAPPGGTGNAGKD